MLTFPSRLVFVSSSRRKSRCHSSAACDAALSRERRASSMSVNWRLRLFTSFWRAVLAHSMSERRCFSPAFSLEKRWKYWWSSRLSMATIFQDVPNCLTIYETIRWFSLEYQDSNGTHFPDEELSVHIFFIIPYHQLNSRFRILMKRRFLLGIKFYLKMPVFQW